MSELEFAPTTTQILLDLFPASVYNGVGNAGSDQAFAPEARVIVTNDYIYVIVMEGTGPVFAVKEELVELKTYLIDSVYHYEAYGANFEYTIRRNVSCGCGNRLRGMRLLPGIGHAAR